MRNSISKAIRPSIRQGINGLLIAAMLVALIAPSCKRGNGGNDVLAECYGSILTRAELVAYLPKGLSKEDSTAFSRRYIEEWVRESAVAHEAKAEISDLEAIMAVRMRQYERRLARQAYGDWVVATQLDTTLSDEEISNYYRLHPDKFVSTDKLYSYFHVATDQPENLRVATLIQGREYDKIGELVAWCKGNASEYRLDSSFVDFTELSRVTQGFSGNIQYLPINVLQTYKYERNGKKEFHFLKLIDIVSPGQPLPLRACRETIQTILLAQRKTQRMEEMEANLAQQAKASGNAKIYAE